MSGVNELIAQLNDRFNPAAAADLEAVFQYEIDDAAPFYVAVKDQTCAIEEGQHMEPSVTLSLDSATLAEIMSGETDGMQAFMGGRLRADGNVMLATRLTELFPIK